MIAYTVKLLAILHGAPFSIQKKGHLTNRDANFSVVLRVWIRGVLLKPDQELTFDALLVSDKALVPSSVVMSASSAAAYQG